jgi:O-antigen/teichoic acid export membrane protein
VDHLQRLVTASSRGLLLLSFPIALTFAAFGREIVTVVFGPEFAAADGALAILSAGQLVNAAAGSVATLLVMTGNQRQAALGIASGACLNGVIGVTLIPTMAVNGAAVAAACSMIFSNLLLVELARRSLGIHSTALGRITLGRRG